VVHHRRHNLVDAFLRVALFHIGCKNHGCQVARAQVFLHFRHAEDVSLLGWAGLLAALLRLKFTLVVEFFEFAQESHC